MPAVFALVFCICAALVVYAYLVYPILLGILAKVHGASPRRKGFKGSVSVILAAYNEEATIQRRLEELTQ